MKKSLFTIISFICICVFMITLVACRSDVETLESLSNEYGIVVDGGGFEEGSTLISNEIAPSTEDAKKVIQALSGQDYNKEGRILIFDIYVTKDGKKVQPNESVSVSIPVQNINVDDYLLFHVKSDNSVEKVNFTINSGKITFKTSSFSYFVLVEEKVIEHIHTYELVEGVEPSCIKEGTLKHYHCNECGKNFDMNYGEIESIVIEKENHQYLFVEEVPATCKEEGIIKHYHCDVCGKNFDMNYGEIDDLTIEKSDHEYGSMYYANEPTFFNEGNIAYYHCDVCDKYFNENRKEVDSVVLPKLSTNLSICVNGAASPFVIKEQTENQIIWSIGNLSVKEGDIITICQSDDESIVYKYFAEGNVDKDGKIITTAENISAQAVATPNGIMLFVDGYKYEGIVIEINGVQYPMEYVEYPDGTPSYIYGYVTFEQGDEFVIIDNLNNITYDYDDLDVSYMWDTWDFHRGDSGEFVIDYSARYGIEFDYAGNKKIFINKVFAPVDGSSYEIVFNDETIESIPLIEVNFPSDDPNYEELLWYTTHEKVMNNEDIVSYIKENGLSIYTDTVYFEEGVKFNILNITKKYVIDSNKLTEVYTTNNKVTKDGDYVEILESGNYMITYMPAYDAFMVMESFIEEVADIFMYLDGEFIPLMINDDNTVTYEGLEADTTTNISFISNNYMEYYPITIDSNTDSSIAYVIASNGMSFVFFNKAGTYNLTYNVETGMLTIVDQNPEVPGGDTSKEYIYFLSVVDYTNGNQTIYFTRTPDENKEVVIEDAILGANCYIAVSGVALDGSDDTVTYGALSNTDSSIATSYGSMILVKIDGKFDVYFNTEEKSTRLVLNEEPKHDECTYDDGVITKEATHLEEGIKTYTCTVCGETKEEPIAKLPGHNFGIWQQDKENADKHYKECECGEKEIADCTYNEGVITKDATHAEEGVKTYTCTECGRTKDESIAKLSGHSYSEWKPDGENKDKHYKECECGDKEIADCTYNEGVITKDATHAEEGVKTYTCTECGRIKEESIAKIPGHSFGEWTPDEVNDEQHYKKCECGEKEFGDCVFDDGVADDSGATIYTCTICGREKSDFSGLLIVIASGTASFVGKDTISINDDSYGENANVYLAQENDVLDVTLTDQAGRTFMYWVSASGTIIPDEDFSMLVLRSGYYYPVFEDVDVNEFANRQKIYEGNCEEGILYMSTNSKGDIKYELEFINNGYHDFDNIKLYDDRYHKKECLICGHNEFYEHYEMSQETVKEASHAEEGLVKYVCECGHEWTETLPITDEHSIDYDDWHIVEESKNGQYGKYRVYCEYCDYYEEYWYLGNVDIISFMENKMIHYQATYGGKVTHDEYYYNYRNAEGKKVYIWALQYEYGYSSNKDYNDTYIFMYIDDEDSTTIEPIYLSKSKGDKRAEYLWAIYAYAYDVNDWIDVLDSPDNNIGCNDGMLLSNSMSARSSVFESYHNYWAETYNKLRIPTSKECNDLSDTSWEVYYEGTTFEGGYYDENDQYISSGGLDMISYVKDADSSYKKYMHVLKDSGITYGYEDWGTSYRSIYIMRKCKTIVSPEEYDALDEIGKSVSYSYGDIENDIKSLCSKRNQFNNFTLTIPETINSFRFLFSDPSSSVEVTGNNVNVYYNSAYVYNSGSSLTLTWQGDENLVFDRYEIWDFNKQAWTVLSTSSEFVFNSSDNPRREAAYVRVVYHKDDTPIVPGEKFRLSVENGYFIIDGDVYNDSIEVEANTLVYVYANEISGKTFDHWIDGNGEELYGSSINVTSHMNLTPVYVDREYSIYYSSWNYEGKVSVDGGESYYSGDISGKIGDSFEFSTTPDPESECNVFMGWYLETYIRDSLEYILISDQQTFTYEIVGEINETIYTVWTTGENPFIKKYVDIRITNGFVMYGGGEVARVFDNAYSAISLSKNGFIYIFDDPSDEIKYSMWDITYRYELEGELIHDTRESYEDEYNFYPADFWVDNPEYSYPDGEINITGMEYESEEPGLEEGVIVPVPQNLAE